MAFRTSDFDYTLEPELIAQAPLRQRDDSRLMRLDRSTGSVAHHRFRELPDLLRPGDLLVFNDTRVVPAKFTAIRATGGRIEGLFCRETEAGRWQVLLKGAGRCRIGEMLRFEGEYGELEIRERHGQGRFTVGVLPPAPAVTLLERVGRTPLPPYIRRPGPLDEQEDRESYQTVFAERPGAVAAPTAGLHFTGQLLRRLEDGGVQTVRVTLHVGLGTFAPVKEEDLSKHPMHSEWYELSVPAAERIAEAREQGRRVVAVGTTSVRVLESVARCRGAVVPDGGLTDLFLYPPAEFHVVDALVTNFHLPKSTLLMLVAAFCDPGGEAGLPTILKAYNEARRRRYRFYSYGDAMLIE